MANCPEISIFTDEDPFVFYARYLINSFKNTYGASIPLHDGKNVFEYSSELYDSVDVYAPAELRDLSTVKAAKVIASVNWDTSLPLYIKGPGWGTTVFSEYSETPWDVRTDDKEGWFDLAGSLVVHPMLRLDHDAYAAAFEPPRPAIELPWDDHFRGTSQVREAFPLGSAGGIPRHKPLKFGFLLEVLDAFIHIHDEAGGTLIQPGMESITWCQMFWSGYESEQGGEFKHLGKGSRVFATLGADEPVPAWEGVFDFYSPESGYVAIEYIPRRDVGYTTEGWTSERDIEPELVGPIHSTSAFVGSSLAGGSGFDVTPGIQGHSVKINNAGYAAFVRWLRMALELLDEGVLGPVAKGPARTSALTAHDDFLSQVFIDGGAAPRLSVKQCQETGAPYGGFVSPDENNCNIKVFRAMADLLYFNENPLADSLDDLDLDYWNKFLDEHSVSVSLSTEALNEAILGSGVDGYCDAADLPDADAPDIGFKTVNPGECRIDGNDLGDLVQEPFLTCIPDPQAVVPNWLNQPEGEPFFNKKVCEYSIVMLADPPECSEEYFASFIPEAVNKLLDYYGKELSTDFLNLSTGAVTPINSRDALIDGSDGLYLDALVFSGTAQVRNFYIPPRPLAKTKVLITVAAEEFNRIPDVEVETEEDAPFPIYLDGEPSFVVFLAEEMKSLFDKISETFVAYDRLYAKWHLETGKTIQGLNFKNDATRLESFYKETELLLKQAGYRLSDLQWVEIGFSPQYQVEYVKVQKPGSPPVKIGAGFNVYKNKAPMTDRTAASYVSKLPSMVDDLMIREPMSWYDIISKYRDPLVQESYALDLSSPTVEGNEGLKAAEQVSCPAGSANGIFEPNLFGSSRQKQKWAESQINDIKGALLSQFSSNPCALVDAKILEQQGREDFVMQVTDMTLKEYLTSDRFINDIPELLVRGRFNDIESLYGGMLNNLGRCGIIDLIKSAVDCLLNALGYDDAITIILSAAIRGMDDEFIGKFIGSLGPREQELIAATINEVQPGLLPLLAGYVQITVADDNGDIVDPVYDHTKSYTSEEYPLGSLKPSQVSIDPPTTDNSAKTKISLKSPPDSAGSLGKEQRAATAQDYALLKDVVADMIMDDLFNVDEIVNVLNNIPGAAIAVSIIKKLDKYCVAPPIMYPPLRDFIQLPGVNIDFCELEEDITIPVFPKIKFNTFSGILIENALRVLEELLIRLLILILKKILQIIAEELCKTRVGSDPLNLRDALKNGLCGDGNVDDATADGALTDLIGALGCLTDPTAVGRLVDNVASVITQCELLDLINGEGSDNLYALVVEIIKNDPVTEPLSECLYDKESVHTFFKSIGVFVDLDQLCINDPADLPVSREVCDNMGLLNVFRATRADALRAKGVDEECIQDQLCVLRDQTVADLEDLMSLLQVGIFNTIMPNIMNDATSDNPSLLPADMPSTAVAIDGLYNNIMDSMSLSFTEDMIGRRGFFNMVLADSRGRGYNQHLKFQQSIIGPRGLNIYGSRGTRTQPPRDEWDQSYKNGTEDHNAWVQNAREFTDGHYWKLPFLFSPLSSQNPDETPDNSSFGKDEGNVNVKGQAPALGGLPDKVAGHLQDTLATIDASFNINNPYTTDLYWVDYEKTEAGESPAMEIFVSYDYWTDPPTDINKYSWDGHRARVQTKIEGSVETAVSGRFKVNSSVEPTIAEYKELFLAPFYADDSVSPDATFQALIKQRVSSMLGSLDSDGNGISDADRFLSSYESFFGSGTGLTSTINSFERINSNMLEALAELVAAKGSVNSPFNYGFDTREPPKVVYFHDDGEAYEGDIAGAVARYGGSERNPPFYIKPPKSKGFLKIAEKIIPDFTPCEDPSNVIAFPEFNSLATLCSEFSSEISEDERAGQKVKGVSTRKESPFDRHLSRASLGVIEGTIFATIRTYTVEVLLKAMPVLKYLSLTDYNYGLMLADFVISKMEDGMKDVGRGRRYREKYKDYWWLFLEQVVQNYAIKVKSGIITDQTPEEEEAIEFINQYVKDNWKWKKSDTVVGLNAAKRVAKDRKERWDNVFEDPETKLDTPIIDKCKVILRRYVTEEYARTSDVFSKYVKPEHSDINDIIIQSPLILRGAISDGDDNDAGPIDVPSTAFYSGISTASGIVGDFPHPYEDLKPLLVGLTNNSPFVLERYVIAKGSSEAANTIKTQGLISNIFDAQGVWGGQPIEATDEVYFGLRIVLAPEALGDVDLLNDYKLALNSTSDATGYNYKAFSALYRNTIPLASAEIPIRTESFSAEEYNDYLQDLVCKLVETPEYKTLFRHCFPLPKYMDLLAVYCANTFVPSLARVEDGWASTVGRKKEGGGQWIGFGKSGGMRTWRGNEGMKNSFMGTKIVARQTLEAACETSYDYKDRDYQSPSEVYVENSRPNSDLDPGLKWWQWSSLRPPPCKDKE